MSRIKSKSTDQFSKIAQNKDSLAYAVQEEVLGHLSPNSTHLLGSPAPRTPKKALFSQWLEDPVILRCFRDYFIDAVEKRLKF